MPLEHAFIFPLPNGLHARPASHLEALTSRFVSNITLTNQRTGAVANAKSVLAMIGADLRHHDPSIITIDGPDERAALAALVAYLRDEFPTVDEPLPPLPGATAMLALPRSLKAAGLKDYFHGTPVTGGIGWGQVAIVGGITLPAGLEAQRATDPAAEQHRATQAISALAAATEARIPTARNASEAAVLKAHVSLIHDPAFLEKVAALIVTDKRTAAQAILGASGFFIATLQASQSAYLRERVLDIQDICTQLLEALCGKCGSTTPQITGPTVCVADHLTPGQLLALDLRHLKGLVLGHAGTTSHTVILARSMGIPTLVGAPEAFVLLQPGQEVIVDANLGLLVAAIPEGVRRYYQFEQRKLAALHQRLTAARQKPAVTRDGHRVEVGANIASAPEAAVAVESGAEGFGIFRTEMLFMDRAAAPTEEEQFQIYSRTAQAAAGRSVIIRLLDIGGDKPVPYLNFPAEPNPFLGYRGVRFYADFAPLIHAQLRAILRASQFGPLKIMIPMVTCLEEVQRVKAMVATAQQELAAAGQPIETLPPLGVMIETPAAAFLIPEFAREIAFFSVGTNDLAQYFLAVDRDNGKVAHLYTWTHPAFLRLLKKITTDAHAAEKWVGLCGEMGGNPAALPLLIGLGFDEISMAAPRIGGIKDAVHALHLADCAALLEQALQCATRSQVETLLAPSAGRSGTLPLLATDLLLAGAAQTKEEAIKELADAVFLAGRAPQPHLLEEAIWLREETYSTGFGYGFAMPHCKTEHLDANTIAISRLAQGVVWGALDGNPVDVVILLALRAKDHGKEHMRIFAQLSRLVMRDEFRDRVRNETNTDALLAFLKQSLGLENL